MPPATYAGDRRIIDVDSHVIELDDFLWNTATPSERKRLPKMANQKVLPVSEKALARARELFARRQVDAATRSKFEENLTQVHPNGWGRLGAFDPAERSHALDLFGFELQWVLPTFAFHQVAHSKDPSTLALGARVLNRAMAGFCSEDDRLFSVGYLPLSLGPEAAASIMDEGFAAGCYTFMVDTSEPDPTARSFTHPDFDPIWERFDTADVPFVVHVAVNGHYEAVPKSFRNNRRAEAEVADGCAQRCAGFRDHQQQRRDLPQRDAFRRRLRPPPEAALHLHGARRVLGSVLAESHRFRRARSAARLTA